ncbi:MAG: B12-binding domain-containing radical SAM protein, partial [Desulfobacteraceae bacterium]|nr:B12-binding domain-containing radical SAM protein [Desulfobacteraceae bacterium]
SRTPDLTIRRDRGGRNDDREHVDRRISIRFKEYYVSVQWVMARSSCFFSRNIRCIPPLGLAYIAAYLAEHGHECRIIDGIAEPLDFGSLCDIAREYDIIGITVVTTYYKRAGELIHALRDSGSDTTIAVGGPHVTVLSESLLEEGADYAVVGEGEVTMLELLECLFGKKGDPKNIPGLVFWNGTGYHYTGRRSQIDPLDQIPLPARELLPMHRYKSSIARASCQPSHSMLTSRGCPGVCTFCSKKTFGTAVRYFSADRIVEEFFILRDKYGARDVAIWDDNFISDQDVVLTICERLRHLNFDCSWSVEGRIDCINQEILQAVKDAGCTYIALGIESGSQRVLNHVNKKITKEQICEAVSIARKVGILVRGYFMMGLTTETAEEMN